MLHGDQMIYKKYDHTKLRYDFIELCTIEHSKHPL